MVNANAAEERKSAKTGDARRMHFARARKGQYRDKVERITYRIPSVHTEKENGKCHVARAAAVAVCRQRRDEREKKGAEENKRARVYVRGKPGEISRGWPHSRYEVVGRGHQGTNTIKEAGARANGMDKERRKRRTRRKNERGRWE